MSSLTSLSAANFFLLKKKKQLRKATIRDLHPIWKRQIIHTAMHRSKTYSWPHGQPWWPSVLRPWVFLHFELLFCCLPAVSVVSLVQTERASAAGQAAPSFAVSGCRLWPPSQSWLRQWVLETRRWAQVSKKRNLPSIWERRAPGEVGTICCCSRCLMPARRKSNGTVSP